MEKNHTEEYINKVKATSEGLNPNENIFVSTNDVYLNNHTFSAAKLSADACLTAVTDVLDDDSPLERGYCIIRPPGHHCKHDQYDGFCFFNNVALAAKEAVSQGKKVLIFDWDVH